MKFTDKILFVVSAFPALTETFIVNQINSLIAIGFRVQIFSYLSKNRNQKLTNPKIYKYNLLKKTFYADIHMPKNIFKRYVKLFLIFLLYSYKIRWKIFQKLIVLPKNSFNNLPLVVFYKSFYFLTHEMPAIIHVHFGKNALLFVQLKELGIIPSEVKIIVTFHGIGLTPSKIDDYKLAYKKLFKYVDTFTVNSVYMKSILLRIHPKLSNIILLPVQPDLEIFNTIEPNKRTNKDILNIVYCGRLIPLKGAGLMIEIARKLKEFKLNFKMHIIGDGELQEELLLKTKEYFLENNICFYGGIQQEKIKSIFSESHLYIMPGILDKTTQRAETQGLVIQEAQAMGLPVLVSDVGGMKYGMIDEKTGYVIRSGSINGFVKQILFLNSNEEIRYKMGQEGIYYVNKNFSKEMLRTKLIKKIYKLSIEKE